MYDVIIIGAGVSGAAIARELSRYEATICVLEKEEDLCCGTSKANSGIIHAGYDAAEGTLKAKLNIWGNQMMEQLSRELDFPFRRTGSLVVCTDEEELPHLQRLYERGMRNGVSGLRILSGEEVFEMEPNVAKETTAALYAPTAGIVCPFGLNIALAENAAVNGVEFQFDTEVQNIRKAGEGYVLETDKGDLEARYVVNAAGVYADKLHNMVSRHKMHITARRGEYALLDKSAGRHVKRTIFALPGKLGKGVLVTPTVHGNLLIGPTAADVEDKEGIRTTREGLEELMEKAGRNAADIPMNQIITSFAGLRAHEDGDDFIIQEAPDAEGFIDCAGIESPGLTSAPAIGVFTAEMLREKMNLKKRQNYISKRKGILNPQTLNKEERKKLIQENPAYGNIICRCEMISEGEIIDAVKRPLGAKSLDGVKRRTRAGMGRCQSGFCAPKVMEIIADKRNIGMHEVTKSGGKSFVVTGTNKEIWRQ